MPSVTITNLESTAGKIRSTFSSSEQILKVVSHLWLVVAMNSTEESVIDFYSLCKLRTYGRRKAQFMVFMLKLGPKSVDMYSSDVEVY